MIVEPLQGSAGVIPGERISSRRCARRPRRATILLVFDEVMTSRLATGGLQQVLDITPDLTTLRQVPRRRARVRRVRRPRRPDAPFRPVAAGRAAARGDVQQRRADDGRRHRRADAGLRRGGGRAPERARRPAPRPPQRVRRGERRRRSSRPDTARSSDSTSRAARCGAIADIPDAAELRALLHLHMLERGYSYARRGFLALSLPMEESDVDGFASAVEEFLR